MNKFKELLFLKNIKGLAKKTINKKYLNLLDEYSDLDDLITEIEYKFGIELKKLEDAKLKAEKIYDAVVNDSEIEVITLYDDKYPKQLLKMENEKPLILYVKGNVEALKKPNIAVIGTRKPSKASEIFEENMVKSILNSSDRVVVSGLALGCDKIAHQTTVNENKATIAVLPSGINVIKPAKHKGLAQDIIETGGCLITEYEPDITPYKKEYVERDKIVAAFCDATFVVECSVKSGTMHTVNAAFDYDKQVYAYLPSERPEGSYDGNEFILNVNENAIEVDDIGEFINDLETLNVVSKPKSGQSSLDIF